METLKEYQNLIEKNFDTYLKSTSNELKNAMKYSLNAGGKRLRPILLLEFFKAFNSDINQAIPYAVAIEFIHTYSLIHDDLPCMDNDDFRRGKPTCHKAFSEDLALLAGDALLNLAFETMSDCDNLKYFTPSNILKVIENVSKAIGARGMISGQVFDTQTTRETDDLALIHKLKTGKLITTACVCGVILGGGCETDIKNAQEYAQNLGLAFQIKDDLLDVLGDSNILGKPVLSDVKNNKTTYVNLYGIEKCEQLVAEYTDKAISFAKNFSNKDILTDFANYLVTRDR